MFLGIDAGGTHTDAVIIHNGMLVAKSKVITNHKDLISSIRLALELLPPEYLIKISRITIGTTLAINAVVQDNLDPVGLVLSAGPGLSAGRFAMGKYVHIVKGGLNHCGDEVEKLDLSSLDIVLKEWIAKGIKSFAFVTKFSPLNAEHEQKMARALDGLDVNVIMGHKLSGLLNFPRRIATAYINAAVWRSHNEFLNAVECVFQELNIKAPIKLLKADGGTVNLDFSRTNAVQCILSGPAASVMGAMALGIDGETILLDMGGTTTDIALFVNGSPVLDYKGMSLSYQNSTRYTLVHSLAFLSIGIGGDSQLTIDSAGKVKVGPKRIGAAMAFGGLNPTLMDALIVGGQAQEGNGQVNAGDGQASLQGINMLAQQYKISAQDLVNQAIEFASNLIEDSINTLLKKVNSYPIHTIKELLETKEIKAQKIWLVGGPAQAMSEIIQNKLKLPLFVPKYFDQVNAIGAALTMPTAELELFANTRTCLALIPKLGKRIKIPNNFNLSDAENMVKNELEDFMIKQNQEEEKIRVTKEKAEISKEKVEISEEKAEISKIKVEITESQMFSVLDDYGHSGKDLRVSCQIKPNIIDFMQIK